MIALLAALFAFVLTATACAVPSISPVLQGSADRQYSVRFRKCERFTVNIDRVLVYRIGPGDQRTPICALDYDYTKNTCRIGDKHVWTYGAPVAGYEVGFDCPPLRAGETYEISIDGYYPGQPESSRFRVEQDGTVTPVREVCEVDHDTQRP